MQTRGSVDLKHRRHGAPARAPRRRLGRPGKPRRCAAARCWAWSGVAGSPRRRDAPACGVGLHDAGRSHLRGLRAGLCGQLGVESVPRLPGRAVGCLAGPARHCRLGGSPAGGGGAPTLAAAQRWAPRPAHRRGGSEATTSRRSASLGLAGAGRPAEGRRRSAGGLVSPATTSGARPLGGPAGEQALAAAAAVRSRRSSVPARRSARSALSSASCPQRRTPRISAHRGTPRAAARRGACGSITPRRAVGALLARVAAYRSPLRRGACRSLAALATRSWPPLRLRACLDRRRSHQRWQWACALPCPTCSDCVR